MAFVGWVALGVGALLGRAVVSGEQTATDCAELKKLIEDASTSPEEQLVISLGDGTVLCNQTISISENQSVQVVGVGSEKTVVSLNSSGVWGEHESSSEGRLFDNSGSLHLQNLEFDLDNMESHTTFSTRVVRNSLGNVSLVECSFIGVDSSNTGQLFIKGQAIYSEGNSNTEVFVSGVKYSDPSPAGSVIVAVGAQTVVIEDSVFELGISFPADAESSSHLATIYTGTYVDLEVTGSTFSAGSAGVGAGMAISCHGGIIRDCIIEKQVASVEGGAAVGNNIDLFDEGVVPLTIEDSYFWENDGGSGASSVAVRNASLTVRDTEFVRNIGGAIMFDSWSPHGEHQILIEDCEFSRNRETTEFGQSKYDGGAAVIARNLAASEAVMTGTFTDMICDMNEPSQCEILGSMVVISHEGDTDCASCYTDVLSSSFSSEADDDDGSVSASGSSSASSPSYSTGSTPTSSPPDSTDSTETSSSTGSTMYSECLGDDEMPINSCQELKAEMEDDEGPCRLRVTVDMTCDESITVASGHHVVVSGLRDHDLNVMLSASSVFASGDDPSAASAGASMFVVEEDARLTLESLRVKVHGTGAADSARVVHSFGALYVQDCSWNGSGYSSLEYGGAILSDASSPSLTVASSSMSNFTTTRYGGAIYAPGEETNVTITGSHFTRNMVDSDGSAGGAVFATSPNILDTRFVDNAATQGAAVYLCGGNVYDTWFVGGSLGDEDTSNGGMRSNSPGFARCEEELVVTNCFFAENSAVSSSSSDHGGGSALQVFNTNLSIQRCIFQGNEGTALYVETSSNDSTAFETYSLAVDSTSFSLNREVEIDGGEPLKLQGSAAIFWSGDGTKLANGGVALDASCNNNGPSLCEVIADTDPALDFNVSSSCHICDGLGNTVAGLADGDDDFALTISSATSGGMELTNVYVASCGALKNSIERGLNGSFELVNDISCVESIKIVEGQEVTVVAPRAPAVNAQNVSITIARPFTSTSDNGSTGDDPDGESLFVVESGGSLAVEWITFRTTPTHESFPSFVEGVRAVYSSGNLSVQSCDFLGLSRTNETVYGHVADGGAIYAYIPTDARVVVRESSFADNTVSGSGGAIYVKGEGSLTVEASEFLRNGANSSIGRGGGIYAGRDVSLKLDSNGFEQNSAFDGAALVSCGGEINAVTFVSSDTAEDGHGAVVSNPQREDSCSRDMIVSDSAFLSNEGGGLVVFNGNLALTDSNFTGNTGTAVYFETSQEDTSFNLEVDGVVFEGNVEPASAWRTGDSTGETGGSALVLRHEADGEVLSTASFTSISCSSNEPSECEMAVEDGLEFTIDDVDCGVCDLLGEAIVDETDGDSGSGAFKVDEALVIGLSTGLSVLLLCWAGYTIWVWRRWKARKKQQQEEGNADNLVPKGGGGILGSGILGGGGRDRGKIWKEPDEDAGKLAARPPGAPVYVRSGSGYMKPITGSPGRSRNHPGVPPGRPGAPPSLSIGPHGPYPKGRYSRGQGEEDKLDSRTIGKWPRPSTVRHGRLEAVAEEKGDNEDDDSTTSAEEAQVGDMSDSASKFSPLPVEESQPRTPTGADPPLEEKSYVGNDDAERDSGARTATDYRERSELRASFAGLESSGGDGGDVGPEVSSERGDSPCGASVCDSAAGSDFACVNAGATSSRSVISVENAGATLDQRSPGDDSESAAVERASVGEEQGNLVAPIDGSAVGISSGDSKSFASASGAHAAEKSGATASMRLPGGGVSQSGTPEISGNGLSEGGSWKNEGSETSPSCVRRKSDEGAVEQPGGPVPCSSKVQTTGEGFSAGLAAISGGASDLPATPTSGVFETVSVEGGSAALQDPFQDAVQETESSKPPP